MESGVLIPLIFAGLFLIIEIVLFIRMISLLKKSKLFRFPILLITQPRVKASCHIAIARFHSVCMLDPHKDMVAKRATWQHLYVFHAFYRYCSTTSAQYKGLQKEKSPRIAPRGFIIG